MSYIQFHDISYAQGAYNMDADPSPIVFMKMSGFYYGSKQPYYDVQAARNYQNAIRTGKLPGLYHFAGGADPVTEADFFVGACSPLADGDLLILDYELTAEMSPPGDPSAWCLAFVERVKERTGKYPLFYTYTSMLNQFGFKEVLKRCGLWIANYGVSPDADIPGSPPYIIHQYQGSPLDTNACYINLDTLRKYTYSSIQPQPDPTPVPTPDPTPVEPVPTPDPVPSPMEPTPEPVEPTPTPTPEPTPEPTEPVTPSKSVWNTILDFIKAIFSIFKKDK